MHLSILAVGEKMPAWVDTATQDYLKRMPKSLSVKLVEIAPEARAPGKAVSVLLRREGARLQAAMPSQAYVVLLDERGEQWSSEQLAKQLQAWMQNQPQLAILIGGADGVDPQVRTLAQRTLALSKFTLPHALARVMLVEQLYRATTIIAGHPYHRA